MKKIKLLIVLAIFTIVFINLLPSNAASNEIYASTNAQNSVYTLSETGIDEETNKVAYQKISYSKNTYQTTTCSRLDAGGSSVEVSEDAQYVFFPARYLNLTDNTVVSFKYKNNGVQKIYLHAEYNAGITKGGVDYESGFTFVCLNVLTNDTNEAWNVTQSKSVDGCDVATVIFGNYTKAINDFMLTGFRMYFDYGLSVEEERSIEFLGYEVHESGVTPNFASDPRPTRYGKLTSEDVEIKNNSFTVVDSATVSATIKEFRPEAYKTAISFNLTDSANINFKLDSTSVLNKTYSKGSHTVTLDLNEESYSKLDMVFTGNVTVKITKMEFLAPASIDTLSGSGYTITEADGLLTAKYTYVKSWNSLKGAIRNYNDEYQYLSLKFSIDSPIVLGVYVNDAAIRSHYEYSDPLPVGDHEIMLDVTEFDLLDGELRIYLDAGDAPANNVGPEKTIVFSEVKLLRAIDLPKSEINVNSKFEFTYDGQPHGASGATVTPELELTYEYKLESSSDEEYTTDLPVNAGTYVVRISSPFAEVEGNVYGKTYAYTTLVINKADAGKPVLEDIEFNYENNTIGYDKELFIVGLDDQFTTLVKNGGYIGNATKLYIKYFSSANYNESEVLEVSISRESKFDVTVDYIEEKTVEIIPSTVEYSTDGLNWTSGNGERLTIETDKIYIFRTKSTDSTFASENTYVSVKRPIIAEEDIVIPTNNLSKVVFEPIEGAEFKLGNGEWQETNEFTGLQKDTILEFYIRLKATEDSYQSYIAKVTVKVYRGIQSIETIIDVNDPVVPEGDENQTPTDEPSNEDSSETQEDLPEHTYIVTNYDELNSAVSTSSSKYVTTIYIKGELVLDYNLTLSGKIVIIGEDGASLVFEKGTSKRAISNSVNAEITFKNIKIVRTVTDNTEAYLFRLESNGQVWFKDVEFNVAVPETGAIQQYDRITYVSSGTKMNIYFDNCVFNTYGYFYRGNMIFYNSDAEELPVTGGGAIIYDFRNFKVDYLTHTFTFPVKYKVSTEEDFSVEFVNGGKFTSNTTYYITDGTNTFTYTTDDIQLATPTIDSVDINYINETISFDSKYLVSSTADFTTTLQSGATVTPGMTLYIKEIATGIYIDSEVAEIIIPARPAVPHLESAYECTFGLVMDYYPNAEYKIDGEYQASPVFTGLESGKTYTITVRLEATLDTFASETYEVQVTLK